MLLIKKGMVLFLALILITLVGCSSDDGQIEYTIGIMQFFESESLNNVVRGFIDGLEEAGFVDGDNIRIIYRNASADLSNSAAIADYYINLNVDLVFSLTTPNSHAIRQRTSTIPVVMAPIADAAFAGLVESHERPGGNMTGMSNLIPMYRQINLMQQLGIERVGILYTADDFAAQAQARQAREAFTLAGINYIHSPVSQIHEVRSVIDVLSGRVDLIYIPQDNTMENSGSLVANAAIEAGIPIMANSYGLVHLGELLSFGVDFYELGREEAQLAIRILVYGENPGEIPIGYLPEETLGIIVNETTAKALGIIIPEYILNNAIIVQ